jgi:hypothetical protein
MDELSRNLENMSVKTYDRAFNPLFNELLPPEIVDKIVTEDVLKKGLYGKTQNEIHHKKGQTIMRAEREYEIDTNDAEDITQYDHHLYHYAIAIRDQNYQGYQRKIRLYNKMLRPLQQMGN